MLTFSFGFDLELSDLAFLKSLSTSCMKLLGNSRVFTRWWSLSLVARFNEGSLVVVLERKERGGLGVLAFWIQKPALGSPGCLMGGVMSCPAQFKGKFTISWSFGIWGGFQSFRYFRYGIFCWFSLTSLYLFLAFWIFCFSWYFLDLIFVWMKLISSSSSLSSSDTEGSRFFLRLTPNLLGWSSSSEEPSLLVLRFVSCCLNAPPISEPHKTLWRNTHFVLFVKESSWADHDGDKAKRK